MQLPMPHCNKCLLEHPTTNVSNSIHLMKAQGNKEVLPTFHNHVLSANNLFSYSIATPRLCHVDILGQIMQQIFKGGL